MKIQGILDKSPIVLNNLAVVDGAKEISYKELRRLSNEVAQHVLERWGAGNNIALHFERSAAYIVCYFGVLISGNRIVPIDTSLMPGEINQVIDFCDVSIILTNCSSNNAYDHCDVVIVEIDVSISLELDIRIRNQVEISKPSTFPEADYCILLPTSGTSKSPKRVMHSHANILQNASMHIESLGLRADDRTVIALPMGFGYCNTAQIVTSLMLGGTIVIQSGLFSPSRFFSLVEKYRATTFTAVPSMLNSLLASNAIARYNMESLRYIIIGGSRLPIERIDTFQKRFPNHCRLVQTYGLTEAGPRITTNIVDYQDKHCYSAGKPLTGIGVSIIGDAGNVITEGDVGQIVVNTPTRMMGYYKNQDDTLDCLRGSELYTGDLGYIEDNNLYVIGRQKNILIHCGRKILPEEIEMCINELDFVVECRVYGEAQEDGEDHVIAQVVIRSEVNSPKEQVQAHCRNSLSPYKLPKRIEVVDRLPKTYNGKLLRW
ncbi:MAG: acyl--CoA ligase [Paenibacillaceae bacterium]|nr:acyl--CoA ligase [Paenibacillaceae bacterium]